jgi:prepilin-type N-terminal cleavage/methylation domain-containing protein
MTPSRRHAQLGFTLIEAMVVLGIVGVLAALAVLQTTHYVSRAKRVEAYVVLSAVYDAQKAYFVEEGEYAATFNQLGFSLDGGKVLSSTEIKGNTYSFTLSRPWGTTSFYCMASANIDADAWLDVLVVMDGEPES